MFRRNAHVLLHLHVAQAIRQVEPVTHSSGDLCVHHVPHNDPTLPQLTLAFKVSRRVNVYYNPFHDLIPPSSDDVLRRRESKSVCILLDSKYSITSDTRSVSVTFDHAGYLCTRSNQLDRCIHDRSDPKYVTTRVVRVVPTVPVDGARTRIPTELLIKIFEAIDSCMWQFDLLSLAQVCRRWSQHSMRLLFARLESSEWENHCPPFPTKCLDPCLFAKALRETPFLGLGVQHLKLDQHNGSESCLYWKHASEPISPGFAQALVTILRATKNLQHLHLSLGYSTQASALFSALPKLHNLHTLSITHTTCRFAPMPPTEYWSYSISTIRLVRCMACWPALTSLTVERLMAGNIGMARFFLRPPVCALTQLHIRDSDISDKDLLYLTASSVHTLAQVTLDRVWDITDDGLCVFLNAISRNVTSLTVRGVHSPKPPSRPKEEHALDAVIDKMRCLQALNISGDVASERMLRRRSEMFLRSCESGVPVVRLSCQAVLGIRTWPSDEWAGWDVVEFC
jgi:hypothetical protein